MAYTIFQSGANLYGMDQNGATVSLALPTGVTLDSTRPARFTTLGNYAIMVNSPSRPITIDANLNVRVLCPAPPTAAPTLATPASGALTGTYLARQTYIVRDAFGALIAESDFGPTTNTATPAAQKLQLTGLGISPDTITGSRFYRTATGGAVYFQWMDQDGNTQTSSIQDDLADAGLSTLSAPLLGTPPDLQIVAEYKTRLFGISKAFPDQINYCEPARIYAWPSANVFQAPRAGSDSRGVTGFVRRRDSLGFGRVNGFYQLTGTDDSNFRIILISENCGIIATDSVAVYRDMGFFLWSDGVYQWDNQSGLTCVSDDHVRRMFTKNGTFNLSRLQYAFAHIDPLRHKYRLFLASAGAPVENCWLEYDFVAKKWWGPHQSHAMNPTAAFLMATDSSLFIPMIGGADGFCRADRLRRVDDTDIGIDFDVVTANQFGDDSPDSTKYFGELTVYGKPQPRGTMDVYATSGTPDQPRPSRELVPAFSADLTQDRQRLGRVGYGNSCQLRFRNNHSGEDVSLRGFEISSVNVIGRR